MTPEIQGDWSDSDADVPALARMRRYTTWALVGVVAGYVCLVAGQTRSLWGLAATLAVGGLVCWQCLYWEQGAPRALTAVTLAASYAQFCVIVGRQDHPLSGVAFAMAAGLVVTAPPFTRRRWTVLAFAFAVLPELVVRTDPGYVAFVIAMMAGAVGVFRANRFGYGLFLEVDQARRATAELAVMRERYRFAADLHDIQGQALHVSRLKLRLADKLLDEDPARARNQVREAEQLIADAIAETRRLAYGQRTLTFAGELANSESLIRAAGIALDVDGTVPLGHRLDELFGLVVREATTNLLRHAHAEHVAITIGPDSVRIVNDGATEGTRALSGLARLGERFAAAGGTVTTSQDGPLFTTSARGTLDPSATGEPAL